ncbi:Tubulin tyrosine ligase [Spironucleus salmonicida]|uniref:Tubulin--tyrosine ligase-like protein 5 n=1 Tax=Spironucleus salmonicida TaxID=348837 RepID=V6LHT3_9EUKA|nr:Tubulin tyrosine ligase [Spironucleus salmonicida]|eukprot:EST43863.1 Tubulin tyrosine ligase [Spironucleus salmonicida]
MSQLFTSDSEIEKIDSIVSCIQKSGIPKNANIVRFAHLVDPEVKGLDLPSKLKVYYAGPLSLIVKQTFDKAGFISTRDQTLKFNVCWGAPKPMEWYQTLAPGQIINQWPGSAALGNKGVMARCGNTANKRDERFDVWQKTFVLPSDSVSLQREMVDYPLKWFIYKPVNANRGEGIKLVRSGDRIDFTKDVVVQHYMKNPLLVNSRKFDLRIYVLITSIDPLVIYVYKKGLARFASKTYEKPSRANKRQNHIHLTNFSQNKGEVTDFPTKIELHDILTILSQNPQLFDEKASVSTDNIYEKLLNEIHRTVRLGILAAEPKLYQAAHQAQCAHSFPRRCFGLYGFDIIFDVLGNPKLLEMNISPSTETSTDIDLEIKSKLIIDIMDLVGVNVPKLIPQFGVNNGSQRSNYLPKAKGFLGFQLEAGELKYSNQTNFQKKLDTEDLTRFEKRVLQQIIDEQTRLGDFQRLLPDQGYRSYYESERYLNNLVECFVEYGLKGEL